jgi:desulfoferrodoxin (superoxide reductase-like protein)
MDIFDVLTAISKRKMDSVHGGMSENEAQVKAQFDVSKEYHIPLIDIKKVSGVRFIPNGLK